jgi:hypothetical protein
MIEGKVKEVNQFIDWLQHVVNKPGMYQVNNIEDLGLIMSGYLIGAAHMGDVEALSAFLSDFRSFVNKHFETTFDYDLERLIRFNSSGDKGSLVLFKELFDKFVTYHK